MPGDSAKRIKLARYFIIGSIHISICSREYDVFFTFFTSDGQKVTKMELSNVGHFIEISQVGQMDKETLWVHSDPVSTGKDANLKLEVDFVL